MRTAAREEGRLRGDRSYGSRNGVPGYAEKTDSTAGESAKEENKVESTSTSEGNSSSASEASDSAK